MRLTANAGASKFAALGGNLAEQARRPEHVRSRELRALITRGLIAFLAFFILLGAGWMMGTHPTGDTPKDKARPSKSGDRDVGRIVLELPDGLHCEYLAFNNISQWTGAPRRAICEDAARVARDLEETPRPFAWGRK
jgi:hypothetical protein